LLTIAGIVFRSELAILVGTITLYLFFTRRLSIIGVIIPAGIGGLVIGLLCTVPLDSFFWQSFPLWPEWIAFYYNTIQGHSADWGVSPWYFYLINALPRLMLNPATYLLCIPSGPLGSSAQLCRAVQLPATQGVAFHRLHYSRPDRSRSSRSVVDMDAKGKVGCLRFLEFNSCSICSGVLRSIDCTPGHIQSELPWWSSAQRPSHGNRPPRQTTF
jgi:hypothetical protein